MNLVLFGTEKYRLPILNNRDLLTSRSGPGTRNKVHFRTFLKYCSRPVKTRVLWAYIPSDKRSMAKFTCFFDLSIILMICRCRVSRQRPSVRCALCSSSFNCTTTGVVHHNDGRWCCNDTRTINYSSWKHTSSLSSAVLLTTKRRVGGTYGTPPNFFPRAFWLIFFRGCREYTPIIRKIIENWKFAVQIEIVQKNNFLPYHHLL